MAIVSYISILFTENKYIIFIEWFYLVFYIAFMALYINPTNMLFSFYLSNLLVWRFHDDYTTYRFISFFIVINAIMIHISLTSPIAPPPHALTRLGQFFWRLHGCQPKQVFAVSVSPMPSNEQAICNDCIAPIVLPFVSFPRTQKKPPALRKCPSYCT